MNLHQARPQAAGHGEAPSLSPAAGHRGAPSLSPAAASPVLTVGHSTGVCTCRTRGWVVYTGRLMGGLSTLAGSHTLLLTEGSQHQGRVHVLHSHGHDLALHEDPLPFTSLD